jgi:hypothetical protein
VGMADIQGELCLRYVVEPLVLTFFGWIQGIERACKTQYGFSSLSMATSDNPQHNNQLPRYYSCVLLRK